MSYHINLHLLNGWWCQTYFQVNICVFTLNICISSLVKCPLISFANFLIILLDIIAEFWYFFRCPSYYFLLHIWFINIFFPSVACLFIFFTESFPEQIFGFGTVHLLIFPFMDSAFGVKSNNSLLSLRWWKTFLVCFPKSFTFCI